MQRPRSKDENIPLTGWIGHSTHLYQPSAALDKDKLHAFVPVKCHLREVPRNGAGIQIEREPYSAMLFGFLQRSLISHRLTSR